MSKPETTPATPKPPVRDLVEIAPGVWLAVGPNGYLMLPTKEEVDGKETEKFMKKYKKEHRVW